VPLSSPQEIFDVRGEKGQWVVLVADADPGGSAGAGRRDGRGARDAKGDVEAVDALTAIVPAAATQSARFAERDALDLPKKSSDSSRR